MIRKLCDVVALSVMVAAFFCLQSVACAAGDTNYIYIGHRDGRDYFLDAYSIEIKRDQPSARSWTQKIFPIGEGLLANTARSIDQKFFTDGASAYNSSRAKNPIDQLEDQSEREFMMRCFAVGYEKAFGEKFIVRRDKSIEPPIAPIERTDPIDPVDPIKPVIPSVPRGANGSLTEIVFILDRSGSMGGAEDDTIGGFNSMLSRQKSAAGAAFLTTILFDNKVEVLHDRLSIGEINPITREEYWVRGSTALLDAVGDAIKHIRTIQRYARDEDRPSKTIFCITTDGMENASTKYSYADVKQLIEAQRELGWEFLFLGADIDSVSVAERLGISRKRAANYRKDRRGSGLMYQAFDSAVTSMRSSGAVEDDWADEVSEDERSRQ